MKKFLNKQTLRYVVITIFVVAIGIFAVTFLANAASPQKAETVDVNSISEQILATGSIAAQNQAVLNFQIGGKLIYVPFKEGDQVYQGQTIAQLDASDLQRKLQLALNTYQSTRDSFDQTKDNSQTKVLQGSQQFVLDTQNKAGVSGQGETDIINNTVTRILDQNQANLNISVLNVQLANSAMQLSTLTSPINGIVLHEDVTTAGVNITPATSFVVADPNSMVFSANVRQQDIDFISVGNTVNVSLDAMKGQSMQGVVDKIYPQKIVLLNGDQVYRVDIKVNNLPSSVQFGQSGTVLIKSNFNQKVILVPSWTVLSDSNVWVSSNGKPVLKKINVGDTINGQTEVLGGLSDTDKVITNPESIISKLYSIK
jgi:multidrug efflux pump subunit AcrA (membrane-fusion protein)